MDEDSSAGERELSWERICKVYETTSVGQGFSKYLDIRGASNETCKGPARKKELALHTPS